MATAPAESRKQSRPPLRLPRRFEGTLRRDGEEEHQFVTLRIERTWVDKDDPEQMYFRGDFRHFGPPPFGRGFMMAETDVIGSIHLPTLDFRIDEEIIGRKGRKSWRNFEGRLPKDPATLCALRTDGIEQLHLFATGNAD